MMMKSASTEMFDDVDNDVDAVNDVDNDDGET